MILFLKFHSSRYWESTHFCNHMPYDITKKLSYKHIPKYKSTHTHKLTIQKTPRLHTFTSPFSYIFCHLLSPTQPTNVTCQHRCPPGVNGSRRQASIRRAHLGRLRCQRSRRQRWQAQLNAPWPRSRWMDFSKNVEMETQGIFFSKKGEGRYCRKFSWKNLIICKNDEVFWWAWLVGWLVYLVGWLVGCLFVCFINMNVCMYVCTCRKCVYTEYIKKHKQNNIICI